MPNPQGIELVFHRWPAARALSAAEKRRGQELRLRTGSNTVKNSSPRGSRLGSNRAVHGNIGSSWHGHANESVVITPTLEERMVGIFFEEGEAVDKNQVLVKLDDSEARYLLAEAVLTLREQQKQFERISKLAKTKSTSRSRLDEEQGLMEIARTEVAHLKA